MRNLAFRQIVAFAAAAFVGLLAADVRGGPNVQGAGSGVDAYFASDSERDQASDPPGLNPWTPAGPGPYWSGNGLPDDPPAPLPHIPGPPSAPGAYAGNAFAGILGGWTSSFTGGPITAPTTAYSDIYDNVSSNATVTSDINIGVIMNLTQSPGAPGYAYEQLDFGSNYYLTSNPGLGSSTPSLPILVSGTVNGGVTAYAQFDGEVDYTWTPGTYSSGSLGTTTFTPTGLPVSLGALDYSFYQPNGGSFYTTLLSSGTLGAIPSGSGQLALDGYFWVAGDPVDISISSVPEPSALALLGVGAVGVAAYAWRRRRVAKA